MIGDAETGHESNRRQEREGRRAEAAEGVPLQGSEASLPRPGAARAAEPEIQVLGGRLVVRFHGGEVNRTDCPEPDMRHHDQPACRDTHCERQELAKTDTEGRGRLPPQLEDRKAGVDGACCDCGHGQQLEGCDGSGQEPAPPGSTVVRRGPYGCADDPQHQ